MKSTLLSFVLIPLFCLLSLVSFGQAMGVGWLHTVALCGDSTAMAWGMNDEGQLGNGTNTNNITPVSVRSLNGIIEITAGGAHCLGLKSDGTVWSWGKNTSGELGNGTNIDTNVPRQVNSLTGSFTAVAAGVGHSLALRNDGTVWSWGLNNEGQLGNGTSTNSNVPQQIITLNHIISIATGWHHSLALKDDGTLWAWGWNQNGQLGNGAYVDSNIPIQVNSIIGGISKIAGGLHHSMVLKNDGSVWCWGDNYSGELGNGSNIASSVPVQVSGANNITSIVAGCDYSLALKSDGTVWAWGSNDYLQLGNGTYANSDIPVQVSFLTGITSIAGRYSSSIAAKNDGTFWAWGRNDYGQLGDGTTASSNVPVQVIGLCQLATVVNETKKQRSVSVFPNPSSGIITINLTAAATEICVYDLLGNCLWSGKIQGDPNPKIDLSDQPKGIYFMEIVSENERSVAKMVLR